MQKFYVQETIGGWRQTPSFEGTYEECVQYILMIIVTTVEALLLSLVKMNYKWITCKITKNRTSHKCSFYKQNF